MGRFFATTSLAFVAAAVVGRTWATESKTPLLDAEAASSLAVDDACLEGETCGMSLRQLRGELSQAEVARHLSSEDDLPGLANNSSVAEEEVAENGFCCYAGAKSGNLCGTCFPTSMAEAGSFCAATDKCGGCGGTWCKSVCVMGSEDPTDACGTAYDTAIAKDDNFCAQSESQCTSCKGSWCGQNMAGAAPISSPTGSEGALDDKPAAAAAGSPGFCCYSGSSESDTCGTCYPTAIAKASDTCASEGSCGGCGGAWCKASCVLSSEDAADPCGTADDTAIATADNYCANSEAHCSTCKGSWCTASKLKGGSNSSLPESVVAPKPPGGEGSEAASAPGSLPTEVEAPTDS